MGVFDIRVNEKMCWNVCKCVWNVKNVCWVELPNEPKFYLIFFSTFCLVAQKKRKKQECLIKTKTLWHILTWECLTVLVFFSILGFFFFFFFLGSIMVIFMYCLSFHFHCYIVLWGWGGINMGQNGLLPFSGKLISLLSFVPN